jgi:hypothetical protein
MESFRSFLIKLLILTASAEAFALLWYFFANPKYVSPTMPVLPLFFFAITYLFHRFVTKNKDENPLKFQRKYLIATTVKLLFMLTIIIAYYFKNPNDTKVFIISFFILYIAFTIFEARSLIVKR